VYCGDNFFAEHPDEATAEILRLMSAFRPQLLIAGPAFEAGRYGVACGALCVAAEHELGIPAVAAMDRDNAGADLYHGDTYIIPSGRSATQMLTVLRQAATLGTKLARGEALGTAAEEGYIPRGVVKVGFAEIPAAERVVDMLLAKLRGEPFETEVVPTKFVHVPPASPVLDLKTATIALVTDGGLVPEGNPDHMDPSGARRFSALRIADLDRLDAAEYDVYHSGYDTTYVNRDPHRLVPLDVIRELEREGRFGKLHEYVYATAGIGADVESSARTGRGIAEQLSAAGVEGVILTST
jgi:glycine reductase